jgi:hypothetical protein
MHSFSFDAFLDSPDVEILDYQYGSSRQFATYANKEEVMRGDTFPAWGTYGAMPRGDYLYVKWRIKSSKENYEDRVDFRNRLPKNTRNYEIHFVAKESQRWVPPKIVV